MSEQIQSQKLSIINKLSKFICDLADILFVYAILLIVGQIFFWLYRGVWFELPLNLLFIAKPYSERIPIDLVPYGIFEWSWLVYPHSWIGIHNIINSLFELSFPMALIVFYYVIIFSLNMFFALIEKLISKIIKKVTPI